MNLPNKLTLSRIIIVPLFLAALLAGDYYGSAASRYAALALFCVASFTDFLDGYIARKYNLVTNFGKFADPIADKLLVCSALIAMTGMGLVPSWVVALVIAREFIISGLRTVAADRGLALAASMWGKAKTVSQMVMIIYVLIELPFDGNALISDILIYVSAAFALISGVDYLVKNAWALKEKEGKR